MEPTFPKYTKRKEGRCYQVMEDGVHLFADGLTEQQALNLVRSMNIKDREAKIKAENLSRDLTT